MNHEDILTSEDSVEFVRLRVKWEKKGVSFDEALSLRDLEDIIEVDFPELQRFTPRKKHKNRR